MVRATLREEPISPKAAVELCRELKGKMLEKARRYLEDVRDKKRSVPYKRYYKKIGHRRDIGGPGRYPVKAATYFLHLIENLEHNAEFKGLDPSRLRIIHVSALKGRRLMKYIPRAHGRSSPMIQTYVTVEMVAEEV
jgi:large subunit ribosomal protein L22